MVLGEDTYFGSPGLLAAGQFHVQLKMYEISSRTMADYWLTDVGGMVRSRPV